MMAGLLPFLPPRSGQPQTPSSQIVVSPEWPYDVVRGLYQDLSHVRIAFLAKVHLQFALDRSSCAAAVRRNNLVAALAEALRILQRQQVGQGDLSPLTRHASSEQCADSSV